MNPEDRWEAINSASGVIRDTLTASLDTCLGTIAIAAAVLVAAARALAWALHVDFEEEEQ